MKYRLLRDCPHGKAGSVWEKYYDYLMPQCDPRDGEYFYRLREVGSGKNWWPFPSLALHPDSGWFEEIFDIVD